MTVLRALNALLCGHSFFSFGAGVASPKTLVETARASGFTALGLTDDGSVAGAVELAEHAHKHALRAVHGATVPLKHGGETYEVVLLAASRAGYGALNELLTQLHEGKGHGGNGTVELPTLLALSAELFVLTGARRGFPTRLLARRRVTEAAELLRTLKGTFGDRLFVQLYHDLHPGDDARVRSLRRFAHDAGVAAVAAPEVRLAHPDQFALLDALVCARLGSTVEDAHEARPRNDAAHLWTPQAWGERLPYPDALANAEILAREASFELLEDRLSPARARLPAGFTPLQFLRQRCYEKLRSVYPARAWADVAERLEEELGAVRAYDLADFFLTAAEITDYCRARGILASGRGSAAASVMCYLLGITTSEPTKHNLLFERFLHTGQTIMPDVDIDIASSRRREVIAWVEERFCARAQAMTANRVTYRLPGAVQDLGRALGLPPELRDKLTRALGRDYRNLPPGQAKRAEVVFREVLGDAPVKDTLLDLLSGMESGFVRHLAPHSGGVVLSRFPLTHYSPLGVSSGAIKLLSFDKDDIEKLGLIKLDLLGLRMLATLERAREDIVRLTGEWPEFGDLPDDPAVWAEVARGDTLGLFQIESPGQVRLSTQLRPRSMVELAHQIALFRPGPIQSGTVHPYVRRARGLERAPKLRPPLNAILGHTHGVVLFQEQVLRVAHHYAGLPWADAEKFRKRLLKTAHEEEVAALRAQFLEGAAQTAQAPPEEASAIFDQCRAFQGFGFAESHAHAFAFHTYASMYLRHHYPGAYLAAFLAESPGMWPAHTLAQEARRWGVTLLPLDLNRSGMHHRPETPTTVRLPLTEAQGVSESAARELVLERFARGPFSSLDDLYTRVPLKRDTLEALARAGAFDALQERRDALYRLSVLANALPGGQGALFTPTRNAPEFPPLNLSEQLAWDFETKGLSEGGLHPLDPHRAELRDLGCVPLPNVREGSVLTAGLIIARQKPPTAGGFAFFVIEDGAWRAQVVISPHLWEERRQLLRDARALIVRGHVEVTGRHIGIKALEVWELPLAQQVRGYHYA